jgi:hypothetical protein
MVAAAFSLVGLLEAALLRCCCRGRGDEMPCRGCLIAEAALAALPQRPGT